MSQSGWTWPGSRWYRVDFHTHTWASYDFKPRGESADAPEWIKRARDAGLDAVVVTDHNSPKGVSSIQEAARGSHLTVFPGVEVSVQGVHLLCILDVHHKEADVADLLSRVGISPSSYDCHDTSSPRSVTEVIKIATECGALVIAAHANGPRGVLTVAEVRKVIMKCPGLAAVELVPLPEGQQVGEGWLDPQGEEVQKWRRTARVQGVELAAVWGSDAHSLSQLGRCSTWVKMASPTLEGLRLALFDGSDSARWGGEMDPNRHSRFAIEEITVKEALYLGRREPEKIRFNPWLNAVIGGRGTGKSTILDLLRKVLRREDELGTGEEGLRPTFDRRMKVRQGRGAEGLLTDDTQAWVIYRKGSDRYRLSWNTRGNAPPIERWTAEGWQAEAGGIRERFPLRIFSQKQLFEMAQRPQALLGIIDASTNVGGSELERKLKEEEVRYLALSAEARALRQQAGDLPARRAALSELKRRVEEFQASAYSEVLGTYRTYRRLQSQWEASQSEVTRLLNELEQLSSTSSVPEHDPAPSTQEREEVLALQRMDRELGAVLGELRAALAEATTRARGRLNQLLSGPDATQWEAGLHHVEERYREVSRRLVEAGLSHPDAYRVLLAQIVDLEKEIAALEGKDHLARQRSSEAGEVLRRYREVAAEWTRRRAEFVSQASSELIQVRIGQFQDTSALKDVIRSELELRGFEPDVEELEARLSPKEGSPWSFERLDEGLQQLKGTLQAGAAPWKLRDQRFLNVLTRLKPERLDRLALYLPKDSVEITFRVPGRSGGKAKSISQGSPGQQTAALLAFVLGHGEEPIVLDQPEDDLDNALIYELVVQRLREIKGRRQVIVVTHNANIVVHGDAELVISLKTVNERSLHSSGSLQEEAIRDEICRVMEGGREAFEARYRRITRDRGGIDGNG